MSEPGFHEESDAHILRQIGLDHLNRRVGKTFGQWRNDVLNDYGSCNERRLYRVLTTLMKRGVARRSEQKTVEYNCSDRKGWWLSYQYFKLADECPTTPIAIPVLLGQNPILELTGPGPTPLTPRQSEILNFISGWITENGSSPAYRNIENHFGLSQSGVKYHIRTIAQSGHLIRKSCR